MTTTKNTASKLTMLLALSLVPPMMLAGPVDETTARQRAQTFLSERGVNAQLSHSHRAPAKVQAPPATEQNSYYVFNVPQQQGFVIVSGDDRTPAILGYADNGTLNTDDLPPALCWLLEGYEEQIAWLDSHDLQQQPYKAPARTAIAPLIETRWNQGAPYNSLCPMISYTEGEETKEERAVTGCVATAMAQVMYYHQWPEGETSGPIPGYTTRNGLAILDALPVTTFDWTAMTTTYNKNDTGTAADAVAKLMQYCGWALQMNYNRSAAKGSSAYNVSIVEGLKNYFGYNQNLTLAQHMNYSYTEWVDLIYSELAARRPVVLGGQSTGGGHSFVCDGYQGDDYFHINWGWGGSSDGYFRLSALNPYEQGIGGSSTLDGFSYSQDAVIGISPSSGEETTRSFLSLEAMRFGSTDYRDSQTITRDSSTEDFNGIDIFFNIYSYLLGTHSYDVAVQLVDEQGTIKQTLYEEDSKSLKFNVSTVYTVTGMSIASDIPDGSYYIKVMGRMSGEEKWLECYDGEQLQMTAIISNDQLSITVPMVSACSPTLEAITTADETPVAGYEQAVTVSVTGGISDYHGNLFLNVNGKRVMGKMVDIPAGETVDAHFTYIPEDGGTDLLAIYAGSAKLGEKSVTIAASDATDKIDLDCIGTIENLSSDGKLIGNAFRASVTLTNPSTENTYVGILHCSMRKWTATSVNETTTQWKWTSLGVTDYPLTIAKNDGSTTVNIAFDNLQPDGIYSFRVTYRNTAQEGNVKDAIHFGLENNIGTLTTTEGFRLGAADGTTTILAQTAELDAGSACFVDMTCMSNTSAITVNPSSNPNCLYLLADGAATPQGLSGCNVVCGNSATSITLTDGHDFYSPIDFNAAAISYTRTFTRPATGSGGWNTLCLPFTVGTVTAASVSGGSSAETIDWFHSDSDTGKNFWLKTMTGDDDGTLYFGHADALEANTPYIIALPGEDFGSEWQLTGKAITFSATDAAVSATATGALNGNSFKFCGSTVGASHQDVYMLNTAGNRFILATKATSLPAFRAWIEPVSISSLSRQQLVIGDEDIQGIDELQTDDKPVASNAVVYNLSGQRTTTGKSRKGIFISNGKKIIVK